MSDVLLPFDQHRSLAKTDDLADKYLTLLKQTLTASIYPESAYHIRECSNRMTLNSIICRNVLRLISLSGYSLIKVRKFDPEMRAAGMDWPLCGYTMIGHKRLDNVQLAIETALKEGVPGDIVECGVWRGGCAMFMRAVLQMHAITNRTVWAADSFEGMPKPSPGTFAADKGWDLSYSSYLSVSLEDVQRNFSLFGLLDEQVRFLKGWFENTLPTAPIKQIAVLRADGDLYESTIQILDNLYDKVSPGGFVIIDDYGAWPPCKQAVTDFRARRGIVSPIEMIDWSGIYWRVGGV